MESEAQKLRLTAMCTKAGWAAKIGPSDLAQVLCQLPPAQQDENLLVGLETSDDAGVYRLTPDLALIQTVDFFTPIVDDPYAFGQIAAANALSDVYAMGGKPLTAMNLVAFPVGKLPMETLADILRGGSDKIREAGAVLLGGHSIDDKEPKYGLSVTGVVHPQQVWANAGAQPGDRLILTKPLGIGIISTAIKRDKASPAAAAAAVETMSTLNRVAAETLREIKASVHACTDITGFGLLGHALEMAQASQVALTIYVDQVPVIPEAREYAALDIIPGGSKANLKHLEPLLHADDSVSFVDHIILADAITSGGLLVAVPASEAAEIVAALKERGVKEAAVIGEVTAQPCSITLTKGTKESKPE